MLETMKRILTMAGKYRHKVTIGIIISLLHSFFSAMDLFAILFLSIPLPNRKLELLLRFYLWALQVRLFVSIR